MPEPKQSAGSGEKPSVEKPKQRRFATVEEYETAFAQLESEVASLKSGLKSAAKTGKKATDFEKFLLGLEDESEEEDGEEKET